MKIPYKFSGPINGFENRDNLKLSVILDYIQLLLILLYTIIIIKSDNKI